PALHAPHSFPTRRSSDLHQASFVELAGVEADRADKELPAAVRELLEQACKRGTTIAGNTVRVAGKSEPDRFLGQKHRHLLALLRSEEHTSELQSRFDLVC